MYIFRIFKVYMLLLIGCRAAGKNLHRCESEFIERKIRPMGGFSVGLWPPVVTNLFSLLNILFYIVIGGWVGGGGRLVRHF